MNRTNPPKNPQQPLQVWLINGPNLNLLGQRDPTQYGTFTLCDVESTCQKLATKLGVQLTCFQSNSESAIIERIHAALHRIDGLLINPGAFTHTSYAIRDAIELTHLPTLEIHISDIHHREPFRSISVIRPVCIDQIAGHGLQSYCIALQKLVEHLTIPRESAPQTSACVSDPKTALASLREQISALDAELLQHFSHRMRLIEAVATVKQKNQLPVYQPEREQEVLTWAQAQVHPTDREAVVCLMQTLLKLSRDRQNEILSNSTNKPSTHTP